MSTIVYHISHIAFRVLNVVDVNVVAADSERERERQRGRGSLLAGCVKWKDARLPFGADAFNY